MRHVHKSVFSSDCDGPHEYHHCIAKRIDEDDFDFEARILALTADWPWSEMTGPQEITLSTEGLGTDDVHQVIEAYQQTDEGHRTQRIRFCGDELCDLDEHHQRDVFAERMGY